MFSKKRQGLDIKKYVGIFIFILFYLPLFSTALADKYQCSATWSAGTYSGKGRSVKDAIDDARDACDFDQEVGSHECGSSPVKVNCVDEEGKCINKAAFLEHGMAGGDECN